MSTFLYESSVTGGSGEALRLEEASVDTSMVNIGIISTIDARLANQCTNEFAMTHWKTLDLDGHAYRPDHRGQCP